MISHLLCAVGGILLGLFVGCLVAATKAKEGRMIDEFRERMARAFPGVRDRGDRQ